MSRGENMAEGRERMMAGDDTSDGGRGGTRQRTPAFYAALFVGLAVLQLLLYARSFDIRPAGDDWGQPLSEILRGDREGVGALFRRSPVFLNYRPLQSLFMWVAGRAPRADWFAAIRTVDFVCMWTFM